MAASAEASDFLIYGANGFVGREIARLAVEQGLRPIVAGRDASAIHEVAQELGLPHRIFDLDNVSLDGIRAVLHCAGPFVHTFRPIVDTCIRSGAHYLDITGEISVYEAIAARGDEAKQRGVMLLPGAGFDVVPTDCLAVHLKKRLPAATHLAIAFWSDGPAGLPPGTQRTMIEQMPYGIRFRRDGRIVQDATPKTRTVDFGRGRATVTRITWGDIFMAYHSTAIPNIEDYVAMPPSTQKRMAMLGRLRPLFRLAPFRKFLQRGVKPGPSPQRRARTSTHVWGEVEDAAGNKASALLHGPEAGVVWTARAALAAMKRVLGGDAPPGFQTPGTAYGADFVLEAEGVSRED